MWCEGIEGISQSGRINNCFLTICPCLYLAFVTYICFFPISFSLFLSARLSGMTVKSWINHIPWVLVYWVCGLFLVDVPQTTPIPISGSNTWWDSSGPFSAPVFSLGTALIPPHCQSLHCPCPGHGNSSLCHVENRRLMQAHYGAIMCSARAARAHFLGNCALSPGADEHSSP